jgi:cytochrome bd ubiquinol oxidase subunit I
VSYSDLLLAVEPALLPSRIQMAFTLAVHVLIIPFGVALPTLTLVMEWIGITRKDPVALTIARRWSVVMAVQFAVGAVTGTILSFEFGILWPRLMGRYGAALGLGFAIEGLAFFLEAIFIGIYLYGWRRLRPNASCCARRHRGAGGPDRALPRLAHLSRSEKRSRGARLTQPRRARPAGFDPSR